MFVAASRIRSHSELLLLPLFMVYFLKNRPDICIHTHLHAHTHTNLFATNQILKINTLWVDALKKVHRLNIQIGSNTETHGDSVLWRILNWPRLISMEFTFLEHYQRASLSYTHGFLWLFGLYEHRPFFDIFTLRLWTNSGFSMMMMVMIVLSDRARCVFTYNALIHSSAHFNSK